MKLKVIFSIDPTGMDKDISEDIILPSNLCVYDFHDKKVNRFYNEVRKALEYKGYDLRYHLSILKIYTL